MKANPAEAEKLNSLYTVVKRNGDKLVAVPYSVEYREWLEPAAKLLEQAAARTSNRQPQALPHPSRARPSAPTIISKASWRGWI